MAAIPRLGLAELAEKIAVDGPLKHELAHRRLRGLVGGQWIFDTLEAQYVWEHPYYPLFYVPLTAVEAGPGKVSKDKPNSKGFWLGTLHVGERSVDIAGFDHGALKGLVKIPVKDVDAWYAEDEKQLGPHPKDPYKRIECLASSREVKVEVDGVLVAKCTNSIFLHETSLPTRYYLSPTSITDWSMLSASDTTSFCPYKGEANYYDLKVGDKVIKDAIWYYTYPTAESAQIQNRLCFYPDKVTITVA